MVRGAFDGLANEAAGYSSYDGEQEAIENQAWPAG
jgi:hypothetical protein